MADTPAPALATAPVSLPRVAITYCTQCRWMLRAAYFAQELLSTFGTTIGEIALIPATGGIFNVKLTYLPPTTIPESATKDNDNDQRTQSEVLLWDRKAEGGFPETKVLKQRVRDHLEPSRDLGHSDVGGKKKAVASSGEDEKAGEAKIGDVAEEKLSQDGRQQTTSSTEPRRNADGTVCEDCR